jgi:hypothetical protein
MTAGACEVTDGMRYRDRTTPSRVRSDCGHRRVDQRGGIGFRGERLRVRHAVAAGPALAAVAGGHAGRGARGRPAESDPVPLRRHGGVGERRPGHVDPKRLARPDARPAAGGGPGVRTAVWVAVTLSERHDDRELADLLRFFPSTVELPPLRYHVEDVQALVPFFLSRLVTGGRLVCSPEAMQMLTRSSWPGNIEQLWQVLRRIVQHRRSVVILPADLPSEAVRSAVGCSARWRPWSATPSSAASSTGTATRSRPRSRWAPEEHPPARPAGM